MMAYAYSPYTSLEEMGGSVATWRVLGHPGLYETLSNSRKGRKGPPPPVLSPLSALRQPLRAFGPPHSAYSGHATSLPWAVGTSCLHFLQVRECFQGPSVWLLLGCCCHICADSDGYTLEEHQAHRSLGSSCPWSDGQASCESHGETCLCRKFYLFSCFHSHD